MSGVEIVVKVLLLLGCYERAKDSENPFIIALCIAYLVIGGAVFLIFGLAGEKNILSIVFGILMIAGAIHARFFHK